MKTLTLTLLLASFALGAEETTEADNTFDSVRIHTWEDGIAAHVVTRRNGRTVGTYYDNAAYSSAARFTNSDFAEAYDYYHTATHDIEITYYHGPPERVAHVMVAHNQFANPTLAGTTSLERLAEVIEYTRGQAGERAALLAARAGDMSLLKTWSAWLTHVAVMGLLHANRSDNIKWALIEQSMAYTMDEHFTSGHIAKWNAHFTSIDTSSTFHILKTLTRTDLGLTATDDLPDRLKAPYEPRPSVAYPALTAAHLDEARLLVIDGVLPYLSSDIRGPSAP